MSNNLNKTVLWDEHQKLGARCVDFAGFSMPLNYGSQIEEHKAVRTAAGIFDVSHMVVIDLTGPEVKGFLEYLLANDINKAVDNKALYTCMCNESGGIVDDLIVYNIGNGNYRIVSNAATKHKDLDWIKQNSKNFDVTITVDEDLSILSVQGPEALNKLKSVLPNDLYNTVSGLKTFELHNNTDTKWFISRTGYTGEDGYEIIIPNDETVAFWQKALAANISPIGLAARDTLRLEAGMALYGQDMDDNTNPFESGLAWTVKFEPETRDFVGRAKLLEIKEHRKNQEVKSQMIGLVLEGAGVLRHGQKVIIENCGEGVVTSGVFSPTIAKGIAMAKVNVNSDLKNHKQCSVEIRKKLLTANIVKYPFVRANQIVYKSN